MKEEQDSDSVARCEEVEGVGRNNNFEEKQREAKEFQKNSRKFQCNDNFSFIAKEPNDISEYEMSLASSRFEDVEEDEENVENQYFGLNSDYMRETKRSVLL